MNVVHLDSGRFDPHKRFPTSGYKPFGVSDGHTTDGRRGGPCYYEGAADQTYARLKCSEFWAPVTNPATLYVGISAKHGGLPAATWEKIFEFREGGSVQVDVQVYGDDGSVRIRNGDGTVLATSAAGVFSTATWYTWEFMATVHNSAGAASVRIDGVEVVACSGADTQNTANAYIDELSLTYQTFMTSHTCYFQDIWIDTEAFHGYAKTHGVLPGSDGDADFTCSAGTDHYALVDEAGDVVTSDYTESTTVGHRDGFGFTCPSLSGVVAAVGYFGAVSNPSGGARGVKSFCKSGGSYYDDTEVSVTSSTSAYQGKLRATDPADSAAWTSAKIEAGRYGVTISS